MKKRLLVALTAPVQPKVAVKEDVATRDRTGLVGAGGIVEKMIGKLAVLPASFTELIRNVYTVAGERPLKV